MICTAIYFQDENLASRVVRCVAFAWLQHRRSKLFSIRSLNRLVRAARPGIRCIFLFSCPSKRKPYRLATHLRVYDRQRCARLANLETCSSGSPVRDESGEEQNKDSDRTRYFRVLLVMQLPGTIPSFLTRLWSIFFQRTPTSGHLYGGRRSTNPVNACSDLV